MKHHSLFAKITALGLALILLTACGSPSSQTSSAPSQPSVEPEPVVYGAPTALNITNPNFFGGTESSWKTDWLKTFTSDTGIDLTVTVPSGPAMENGYTAYLAQAASDGALTGLVYVENQQQLLLLLNAGLITPIDPLISANSNYAALPSDFSEVFSYRGHVWAIPTQAHYTLPFVRSYDTAMLSAAGVTAPATTDDFRAFSQALSASSGAVYAAGIGDLGDFFSAFGAPLGESGQQFGYRCELQNVVDSMLLPGAERALQYLRELYQSGALNADFLEAGAASEAAVMAGGTCASCYAEAGVARYLYSMQRLSKAPQSLDAWKKNTDAFTDGPALTAASPSGITVQAITAEVSGYCLIRGSEQGGESVNWLLDAMLDEQLWLRLFLGNKENYTLEDNGYILDTVSKKSGETVPTPELTGPVDGLYHPSDYLHYYSDTSSLIRATLREKALYREKMIEDGLSDHTLTYQPPQYYGIESQTYSACAQSVYDAFSELVRTAVTDPQITVQQALQTYRSTMADLGGDAILTEANAVYGLYPIQQYRTQASPDQ